MTDRVAIPLTDGRWLVLDAATFAAGIAAGESFARADVRDAPGGEGCGQLLTAEEIAARTGIEASWFLTAARERKIPHVRLGKYVRFDLAAVATHLGVAVGVDRSGRVSSKRGRE